MPAESPRSRGNHQPLVSNFCLPVGSPPLTREPLESLLAFLPIGGITPARAGTTLVIRKAYRCSWDHPRSCGNHRRSPLLEHPCIGSPPLTREPLKRKAKRTPAVGITPARAGTTDQAAEESCEARDHPRSRGNHFLAQSPLCNLVGSPPLAREPLVLTCHTGEEIGITPARAGTTLLKDAELCSRRDHPRSRGNHAPIILTFAPNMGSPPLAREPHV